MASPSIPTVSTPTIDTSVGASPSLASSDSSSSTSSSKPQMGSGQPNRLARPKLGSRKSSGTLIIPRDSPVVETREEDYGEGDARTMSPRKTSLEISRMGEEAKTALEQQASVLQTHLMEIMDRVDSVKNEHEKIEGGNRFLQSYIGELITTSKITTATASKPKKGRTGK